MYEFKLQDQHEGRMMEKEVKRIRLLFEKKTDNTMNALIENLNSLLEALRETAKK